MHLSLFAKEKTKAKFPHYNIDVSYDHDKTLLTGKMQVRFYKNQFPGKEILFSLPGNRFLFPDERGIRKHKIVPVFSTRRFYKNSEDPKSPKGFSYGDLKIHSVSVYKKQSKKERIFLEYKLENNPDLEIGYSTKHGLLRVFLPDDLSGMEDVFVRSLEIEFSSKLPEYLYEGSTNGMLVTSNWHPKLLHWSKKEASNESGWVTRSFIPSAATFEINFKSFQSGILITTLGSHNLISGKSKKLKYVKNPLKSFPLIFSKSLRLKKETEISFENYFFREDKKNKIISFFFDDQKRKAELILNWSKSFFIFLKSKYGMTLPWEKIIIVPVNAEYEQVEVINNLILVPIPNYKRSELMDRQTLAHLTRSLGKLWFGEHVWNDQESQLWLNFGIPAFFGLRYFQHKFGEDARIFDTIDWLNPRYRDHYFENMVNSIPPKMNYPIISSFQKNPDSQSFLKSLTYKTAMVISMLEDLLGEKIFNKGLQNFYFEHSNKIVGIKEFQLSFEKFNYKSNRASIFKDLDQYNAEGVGSLDWFFSQWFNEIKTLDYSLEGLTSRKLNNGLFETEVFVKKNGLAKMPFEISLITKDGEEFRKFATGIKEEEKVFFLTKSLPEKVSIDPDEKIMETSRINNHSYNFYRIRFVFDWKKDREHLVLIVPGLGNNAIDGNSLGLGVRYGFGNYSIFAIPGYGTKNKRLLYIFNLDRKNLWFHGLEAGFSFYEFGGVKSKGLRATFEPSQNPGEFGYRFHSRFSHEKLFSDEKNSQKSKISETGESNAFFLEYTGNFSPKDYYEIIWNVWNEQPALSLPSDFSYVRGQVKFGQILQVGYRKSFELELIRSSTSGNSPMQKKFQLGGPSVLRGFPQKKDLSDDHMFVSRLGFKFPLISSGFWGDVSTFKIQGSMFFDQGKIWSDRIPFKEIQFRKSAGVGIEWTLDTVSLFQIPLKLEVAFPLDDQDYKKPQFIFLGVLTGS